MKTLGPWEADTSSLTVFDCKTGELIADVNHVAGSDEESKACCHLIAAAPKHLEALIRIADHMNAEDANSYRADDSEGAMDMVYSIARAAIAEVEGAR